MSAKKYAVIVTSAINTKFGVYNSQERLSQTLDTISSIRKYIPNSKIFLLEMAGVPLTEEQKNVLLTKVDNLIDFTSDQNVTGLYHSTDNWDVVKNVTESMCFISALNTIKNIEEFSQFDRLFKVSGRYIINQNFDISFYEQYKNKNCIIIGSSKSSQFPFHITEVERQFMCRLWSWPANLNDEIIDTYIKSLNFMYQRLNNRGYVDIEHCLYKFLDHEKIIEMDLIGMSGNISPNGREIND